MSGNWSGRYDHAFRIMEDFVAPSRRVAAEIRGAWAHSHIQRARMQSKTSRRWRRCATSGALRLQPTSRLAWKTIPAVMLAAAACAGCDDKDRTCLGRR